MSGWIQREDRLFDPATGALAGYVDLNGREQLLNAPAIQAMVSQDGILPRALRRGIIGGQSAVQNWGGQIRAGDWTVTGGAPTITIETRNGRQCLKIVAPNATRIDIDFAPIGNDAAWVGRASLLVEGNYAAGVQYWKLIATADNFANNLQATQYACLGAPQNDPREQGGIMALGWDGVVTSAATAQQFTAVGATWGTTPPASDGSVAMNKFRLQITPKDASGCTAYFYGLSLAPRRKTGRICVSIDDGYKSLVQLAAPIFQARGIPITLAVIGQIMDDRANVANNYMTWRDARAIIAAGGQCVAHGPIVDMTSNLISALASNDARVADMLRAVQYIRDNGCATEGFERCYVWPQGAFQAAVNDLSLLDAAIAAGFRVGRSAGIVTSRLFEAAQMSRYQRMCMPIVGHNYAGGTEAANITGIVSAISAIGAARADGHLMLHKFIASGTPGDAITILQANLITLADAIVTERDAGRLVPCVMSDFDDASIWAD